MYESLLCLPYFQGMSKDDITAILDKVKLEFTTYGDKAAIAARGEECDKFIILTKGTVTAEATAADGSYTITEEHNAPLAIEPYSMFGYSTTYKHSYAAKGECTVLTIEKSYFLSEFSKQSIFSLNFMNIVSRKVQQIDKSIWEYTPATIEGCIIKFVAQRCDSLQGPKRIGIKMERLAEILRETRLNVSRALNSLQGEGLVQLGRKEIIIPRLEALIPRIE